MRIEVGEGFGMVVSCFLRVSRLIPLFLFFCPIVFFSLPAFMVIIFDAPFSDNDNAYSTI